MRLFRNKLIGLYCHRDWMRYRPAWLIGVMLIPRRDLTPEGEVIWCGWGVEIGFAPHSKWRRLTVWFRSNVGEISGELASRAYARAA